MCNQEKKLLGNNKFSLPHVRIKILNEQKTNKNKKAVKERKKRKSTTQHSNIINANDDNQLKRSAFHSMMPWR